MTLEEAKLYKKNDLTNLMRNTWTWEIAPGKYMFNQAPFLAYLRKKINDKVSAPYEIPVYTQVGSPTVGAILSFDNKADALSMLDRVEGYMVDCALYEGTKSQEIDNCTTVDEVNLILLAAPSF